MRRAEVVYRAQRPAQKVGRAMLQTASRPIPEHAIEEICVIDLEILTVENYMRKLQAKHDWLRLLRENFMRRFYDGC